MNQHNEELEVKSNWSYLYQKFQRIDPKMRKNILIGASMIFLVVGTGFLLATISLVKTGVNYFDAKVADFENAKARKNTPENI